MLVATVATALAEPITPVPEKTSGAVKDRQDSQIPDRVHQTGWEGMRSAASITNRLVRIDPARLLEGYSKRPGRQEWDGEHVGKWLHAATLEWVNSGDPVLRAKLDYVATELAKSQEADGYLGTYLATNRWTSWDVWSHKYNLLGLVAYVRYTGNTNLLPTCTRMGDILCETFGDEPGKRDIIKAGEHIGMAPTSVLEPMMLLYRLTGDPRYLDFCKYILRAWEQPNGPHIVSRLLDGKGVNKVGNGKAYEMLSCLNGALEYYRTTGDKKVLEACLNAWQDIVDKREYLTGAMSYRERFHGDFDLPNVNNIGENCVTVTWIQFNAQLLRLTGEARFADELERVILNQLLGAQLCDGSGWCNYAQMEGKKPYGKRDEIGDCCASSGPRGLALIPTFAVTTDADGVVVNLYESGQAKLALRNGMPVEINTDTLYPGEDQIRITVSPAKKKSFAIKLRIPSWCRNASVEVNGQKVEIKPGPDGYVKIKRKWKPGDKIELSLKQEARLIVGDHLNEGKVAILYGPLVLAADDALLRAEGQTIFTFAIAKPDVAALALTPEPAPAGVKTWPGAQVFRINAVSRKDGSPVTIRLISFADAGGTGSRYKVWLPLPAPLTGNVLLLGMDSVSRQLHPTGEINDDDLKNAMVTFNSSLEKEDWFAVTLDAPTAISRVVFRHGKTSRDGGWFDTSAGKPQVQIQREQGGAWETIGELADYPATTATDNANLKPGQAFTLQLASPVQALAVRVLGVPACGDSPSQNFSSCAELQAFDP
ncbi:MAG: glycoside hydrolase family 127 protein [Verrucomicrobiales bacterium]|nr:glycoside hydrolase family 127 protein [Verrucomicrobiales bacterium]